MSEFPEDLKIVNHRITNISGFFYVKFYNFKLIDVARKLPNSVYDPSQRAFFPKSKNRCAHIIISERTKDSGEIINCFIYSTGRVKIIKCPSFSSLNSFVRRLKRQIWYILGPSVKFSPLCSDTILACGNMNRSIDLEDFAQSFVDIPSFEPELDQFLTTRFNISHRLIVYSFRHSGSFSIRIILKTSKSYPTSTLSSSDYAFTMNHLSVLLLF